MEKDYSGSEDVEITGNFPNYHSPFSLLENSFFKRYDEQPQSELNSLNNNNRSKTRPLSASYNGSSRKGTQLRAGSAAPGNGNSGGIESSAGSGSVTRVRPKSASGAVRRSSSKLFPSKNSSSSSSNNNIGGSNSKINSKQNEKEQDRETQPDAAETIAEISKQLLSGKLSFNDTLPLLAKLNKLTGSKFPFLKKKPAKLQYGKANISTAKLQEQSAKQAQEERDLDEKIRQEGKLMHIKIEACIQEANLFASYLKTGVKYEIATEEDLHQRGRVGHLQKYADTISYVMRIQITGDSEQQRGNKGSASTLLNLDTFYKDHSRLQRQVNKLTTAIPAGAAVAFDHSLDKNKDPKNTLQQQQQQQQSEKQNVTTTATVVAAADDASSYTGSGNVKIEGQIKRSEQGPSGLSVVEKEQQEGATDGSNDTESSPAAESNTPKSEPFDNTTAAADRAVAATKALSGWLSTKGGANSKIVNSGESKVLTLPAAAAPYLAPKMPTEYDSIATEIQGLINRKKDIQSCQLLLLQSIASKSKTIEDQITEIQNRGWNIIL